MTFSTFIACSGVILSILIVLGFWKLCELVARLRMWALARLDAWLAKRYPRS